MNQAAGGGIRLARPFQHGKGNCENIGQAQNNRILVIDDNPSIHADFKKFWAAAAPPAGFADGGVILFVNRRVGRASPCSKLTPAFQARKDWKGQRAVEQGRPYAMAFVDVRMPPGWDGSEPRPHLAT